MSAEKVRGFFASAGLAIHLTATVVAGATRPDASPKAPPTWSSRHALTLPKNRVDWATTTASHWGITNRTELSLHPVLVFFSPRAELKVNWWRERGTKGGANERHGWALSSLFSLAYPTRFLSVVSHSGSLALLPANTHVPPALEWGTGVVLSRYLGPVVTSLRADLAFAPHTESDVPLLDFPFLYQRFATFYAPLVPRLGAYLSAEFNRTWGLDVESVFSYLPIDPNFGVRRAYAVESALNVRATFLMRHRIAAGVRVSTAQYPVGVRTHYLPTLDYHFLMF